MIKPEAPPCSRLSFSGYWRRGASLSLPSRPKLLRIYRRRQRLPNIANIGNFALVQNPVIPLDKGDWELCRKDYDDLRCRVLSANHSFYEEVTGCYVRALVLDFFDFHKNSTMNAQPQEPLIHYYADF